MKPDAPRAEGIPIDYCYGDGVVLDLTDKRAGEEITPGDIDEAEFARGGKKNSDFPWIRRGMHARSLLGPLAGVNA